MCLDVYVVIILFRGCQVQPREKSEGGGVGHSPGAASVRRNRIYRMTIIISHGRFGAHIDIYLALQRRLEQPATHLKHK